MKAIRLMVPVVVMVLAACGPKPPPEPEEPTGPTPEELAQQKAMAEAPYHEAIQKFNEAIWEIKPDLLHEALTQESYDLFMERTRLENELRGVEDEVTDELFLKQQQDYKIVYSIKTIDLETQHAVVVGTIEGEVQWESEINFVEEDELLKIDHAPVLKKAVADLEQGVEEKKEREAAIKTKVEALVADFNTALADGNAEMFEGVITAETAELSVKLIGMLPKKEGGSKKPSVAKYLKKLTKAIERVEIVSIDFDAPSVTLKHYRVAPKKLKKGEEPPAPFEKAVGLVEENGRYYLDLSGPIKSKIEKLEAE